MRDVFVSFIILSVFVGLFSHQSKAPESDQAGNWAVCSDTGKPIPGEGEDSGANTFAILQADPQTQETTAAEETVQETVFTVSVSSSVDSPAGEYVLLGVAATLIVEEIAAVITLCVLFVKGRKRGKNDLIRQLRE